MLLICDLSGSQIGKVSQVERSLNRELAGLSPKLRSTTKRMLYFSAYVIILKSILILILSIQPPHLLISMYGRRAPDFQKESKAFWVNLQSATSVFANQELALLTVNLPLGVQRDYGSGDLLTCMLVRHRCQRGCRWSVRKCVCFISAFVAVNNIWSVCVCMCGVRL